MNAHARAFYPGSARPGSTGRRSHTPRGPKDSARKKAAPLTPLSTAVRDTHGWGVSTCRGGDGRHLAVTDCSRLNLKSPYVLYGSTKSNRSKFDEIKAVCLFIKKDVGTVRAVNGRSGFPFRFSHLGLGCQCHGHGHAHGRLVSSASAFTPALHRVDCV